MRTLNAPDNDKHTKRDAMRVTGAQTATVTDTNITRTLNAPDTDTHTKRDTMRVTRARKDAGVTRAHTQIPAPRRVPTNPSRTIQARPTSFSNL